MSFSNIRNLLTNDTSLLLFPANIVGLIRVGILCGLLLTLPNYPILSISLYITGLLLDGVDGFLARRFNQTSAFGTILDMVTDRAFTALLLLFLAKLYQPLWGLFAVLMLLDLSSHLAVIYSTAIEKKQTHKQTLANCHSLLKAYYNNRWVLSLICLSHDLCLCSIYLYHFMPSIHLKVLILLLAPGLALKTLIHWVQLYYAFQVVSKEL